MWVFLERGGFSGNWKAALARRGPCQISLTSHRSGTGREAVDRTEAVSDEAAQSILGRLVSDYETILTIQTQVSGRQLLERTFWLWGRWAGGNRL